MSQKFLPHNLPALLKAGGLKVVEIDGWQTRGRPASKGPFHPVGVLWHHTADKNGGKNYARWLAVTGRSDLAAPLCHLSIGRDGTVYVCAAGRANHAGVAKPSGPVAGGDGNALYVGVECQNTGSEGWKKPQYDAMVKTGVVLAELLGCSAQMQRGHKETSVTGKIDPAPFDMNRFRGDLVKGIAAATKPTHVPARPAPAGGNHVTSGWALIRQGVAELRKAKDSRGKPRVAINNRADAIEALVKKGPAK